MECRAYDNEGRVHVFKGHRKDPGEDFGSLIQWWGKIKYQNKIVHVEIEPRRAILPYFGEADLLTFLTLDAHQQ